MNTGSFIKFLREFRPLGYSSRDGHAEGEHTNKGRDTPSFYPTLQVLDLSTLGDAADVNPVIKFLPHTLHVCGRNLITGLTSLNVDISNTCKVGQKLGVSLPLLTCPPSAAVPQRSGIPKGLMNYPVQIEPNIDCWEMWQCWRNCIIGFLRGFPPGGR